LRRWPADIPAIAAGVHRAAPGLNSIRWRRLSSHSRTMRLRLSTCQRVARDDGQNEKAPAPRSKGGGAGAQSTGETLERGSSLQHQDLCIIQSSSRSTNIGRCEQNKDSVKASHEPILRECQTKLELPWLSTVPHAAEAERRPFRRVPISPRDTLTLWCTRFLPNLKLLNRLFIGTGL
jgi:hypothetical protein